MNKKRIKHYAKYVIVLVIGGFIGFYICGKISSQALAKAGQAAAASVLVKTITPQAYAHGKTFIARVEAINASDVVPQVSGYIQGI